MIFKFLNIIFFILLFSFISNAQDELVATEKTGSFKINTSYVRFGHDVNNMILKLPATIQKYIENQHTGDKEVVFGIMSVGLDEKFSPADHPELTTKFEFVSRIGGNIFWPNM